MDSRKLDLAAEFCGIVGTGDLFEYLGLSPDSASPEEARAALKLRRRKMQGMQANPKYKAQAIFLIKNFANLDEVLREPAAHLQDAKKRSSSEKLPVLEMSIRTALAGGGTIAPDQEAYLRRTADELGIEHGMYDQLVREITEEMGVPSAPPLAELLVEEDEPGALMRPIPKVDAQTPNVTPEFGLARNTPGMDHYSLLGVGREATIESIRRAYHDESTRAGRMADFREGEKRLSELDRAFSVLSNLKRRADYDSTISLPPVPQPGVATAPPMVRVTSQSSGTPSVLSGRGLPARLEVLGDPTRDLWVDSAVEVTTIEIRNGGDQRLVGSVESDEPWLEVEPFELGGELKLQTIMVRVHPSRITEYPACAVVRIDAGGGGQASVGFTVNRRVRLQKLVLALSAMLVAVVVVLVGIKVVGWVQEELASQPPPSPEPMLQAREPSGMRLTVDPGAENVFVNGVSVGYGTEVVLPEPMDLRGKLMVRHPNFRTWVRDVPLGDASQHMVVRLELERRMDFVPTDDLVKGSVRQRDAQEVMGPRSASMDACIQRVASSGDFLTGTVRVHIEASGRAAGMDVQGDRVDDPVVRACLEREAAAISFSPLRDGDYATVRYDYTVTGRTEGE
jgi:hypothetical protein